MVGSAGGGGTTASWSEKRCSDGGNSADGGGGMSLRLEGGAKLLGGANCPVIIQPQALFKIIQKG